MNALTFLDAIDVVERTMGKQAAEMANRQRSTCLRGDWSIADNSGREIARVENGGSLVSGGMANGCRGTIQAYRVTCDGCGQPKVAIGADMLNRTYQCNHCKRQVYF